MNRMLIRKYLGESWMLWVACALGLFAFAWVRVWVSGLFEFGEVREILSRFRRFERFSPIPFDQLASYEGRVGISYDEPLVLICVVIWGIARGSDVVSGELGRGTLEMLLSHPISRLRLLLTHGLVCVGGLIGLVIVHWCGLWIGIQTTQVKESPAPVVIEIPLTTWTIPWSTSSAEPELVPLRERVEPHIFIPAAVNLTAFGWMMWCIATGLSCCDRFRWRTVGFAVGIHAIQVVIFGLSRAADQLAWLRYWTYCTCYHPQELTQAVVRSGTIRTGFALWDHGWGVGAGTWLMTAIGLAAWLIGARVFTRRDLPAPI